MGKNKSRNKPKPLLAVQGILHLDESFVQPSQESGLLTTVDGTLVETAEQPGTGLVLAPNYGYAVPASSLKETQTPENKDKDNECPTEEDKNKLPCPPSPKDEAQKENKPNKDMSVAQLVRHIGGGKGKPLVRSDVVDDRTQEEIEQEKLDKLVPDDEETSEFYKSIGVNRPGQNPKESNKPITSSEDSLETGDEDTTDKDVIMVETHIESEDPVSMQDSIADYYKNYTQYYYSVQSDPLGTQPLEFSQPIIPLVDDGTDIGGESIVDLARRAQRAKRALERKLEEEKRKKEDDDTKKDEAETDYYDPLPMEVIASDVVDKLNITSDTNLTQYWEHITQNPHDFHRWVYLINYVETTQRLLEIRKVYSAFLPLFPYCFGYWKRYSEIEKGYGYVHRALSILDRGLEFIPLSVDLWLSYLNLYCEINVHNKDYQDNVREQYEKALRSAGMDFRSDALWDAFIQWENRQNNLRRVFALYRKLIQIPTRLYNRHWDNFKALVRDHHPRNFLSYEEYEHRRKKGCKILGFKYKPEPEVEPGEIRKTSKPEDKLMDFVKEKVLAKATLIHEKTEQETDKRWDFEEKIKRPYFHIKPIDKRQLWNWEEYLNFEIQEGNHDRIIILFERCVIPCANYERFWCKYARYLETFHKKKCNFGTDVSVHVQSSSVNVDIGPTKETREEEELISTVQDVINNIIDKIVAEENVISEVLSTVLNQVVVNTQCFSDQEINVPNPVSPSPTEKDNNDPVSCPENLSGNSNQTSADLPPNSGHDINKNDTSVATGFSSFISIPKFPCQKLLWQEVVRGIYIRASVVHCPRKPLVRLQWAAFEEEIGNISEARELIQHVLDWFPNLTEGKMQIIELERRNGNYKVVDEIFEDLLIKAKTKQAFTVSAMKYARFLYKQLGKPDRALSVLRKAMKKDKSSPGLYSYVYEICYERFPSDKKGAFAALELALQNKEFTPEQKVLFAKKKVLFLQEHGELAMYRDAVDQLDGIKFILHKKEEEELRWKEFEAKMEAQRARETQSMQPFPIPTATSSKEKGVPIQFEHLQSSNKDKQLSETLLADHINTNSDSPYKTVPPTQDLILDHNYGYGSNHPDAKLAEHLGHKAYEAIEAKGLPEHLKDTPEGLKELRKRKNPLYIVAPRGSYYLSYLGGPNSADNPEVPGDAKKPRLQAPVLLSELITPNSSPCVNVPDWFVKEGGELCLSETHRGFSIIRYWPHFLSEEGNKKMFKSLRKAVKWHQKQIKTSMGNWRHVPRLVSWLGPCDYSHTGMVLEKCENWPPELLDLVHRLIQLTSAEFNSCAMNLYRHGHDSNAWHADIHPALGSNPTIASISLGALRTFEMRRKNPGNNFIRFPLFPGSLLVMEGATQQDWVHQVPKEPAVREERINLTFRIMHNLETLNPEESKDSETTGDKQADKNESKETPSSSNGETNKAQSSSTTPVTDKDTDSKINEETVPSTPREKQTKIIYLKKK